MKQESRSSRKMKTGAVVSDKMKNTVVVSVPTTTMHPRYGKVITRSKKFYADTCSQELKVGDTVVIMETRPLSKLKRWRVVEKVESQN